MIHYKRLRRTLYVITLAAVTGAIATLSLPAPATAATTSLVSGQVSYASTTTVESGDVLQFDPTQDTTLEISGNLVVAGILEMKPNPGVTHTLRFVGVDEALFVGGGTKVLETDRGLWVVGTGQLDLLGVEKAGWNRTGVDPTWSGSDELLIAPTAVGDYGSDGFAKFVLGSAVPQVAPSLPASEVINLTRSVNIEGTPEGRSHVTILSSEPQSIKYATFRYLGPRQDAGTDGSTGVMGRYPLHFHHTGDGSRGSIVEGNVFRTSGNRAFVPHDAHGVTARDNVAYDIFGIAFWWDKGDGNESHDSLWEHNFVGYVQTDPEYRGFLLSGFALGLGDGNVAVDNAAAGVLGNDACSGFIWPGLGSGQVSGLWEFSGNVAHNNKCHGIHVWQNNPYDHQVVDFIAYRNAVAGVNHGAYTNDYTYKNLYLYENGVAGIQVHAWSRLPTPGEPGQTWSCITVVKSPAAVRILPSSAPSDGGPSTFKYLTLIDTPILVEVDPGATALGQTAQRRATFSDVGSPCPLGTFTDDEGNIHESNIEIIAAAGITRGCNPPINDLYCPKNPVTRGVMAAFLVRAFDLPISTTNRFSDDDDSIFEAEIQALAAAGVTVGCNPPANTKYCPDRIVTRAEMATFLARVLNLPEGGSRHFVDDDDSVHEAAIEGIAEVGITAGCNPPENTEYCPTKPVLRDQMASFLARAIALR